MPEPKERHETNKRVIELRRKYRLSRQQLAEYAGCSLSLVDRWLREPGTSNYRETKRRYVTLIEFALGLKSNPRVRAPRRREPRPAA